MCFSTILSRVLHKYFVYIPPTPLSNGPSVNKVLSCLVLSCLVLMHGVIRIHHSVSKCSVSVLPVLRSDDDDEWRPPYVEWYVGGRFTIHSVKFPYCLCVGGGGCGGFVVVATTSDAI